MSFSRIQLRVSVLFLRNDRCYGAGCPTISGLGIIESRLLEGDITLLGHYLLRHQQPHAVELRLGFTQLGFGNADVGIVLEGLGEQVFQRRFFVSLRFLFFLGPERPAPPYGPGPFCLFL